MRFQQAIESSRAGMKGYVKKVVVLVVVLNLVQLCYFLFSRVPGHSSVESGRGISGQRREFFVAAKNWSKVPSYKSWSPEAVADHSCEAYFGNGFYRILDDVDGRFRCYHSPTLRTSVCQGWNVVMHPNRIEMSLGGEEIDEVRGRDEEQELPVFRDGAFEMQVPDDKAGKAGLTLPLDVVMPQGQVHRHTLRSLLENLKVVSARQTACSEVVKIPTLFVTRFEYANLFHTVTDWYSSYASSRVIGLEERPAVVLVDGHSQSAMDDGWRAFFSDVKYAKHFGDKTVCFDHAIFVPLGYDTALFKFLSTGLPCNGAVPAELDSVKTSRLREFGEQFTSSFSGISTTTRQEEIRILFIRREDYLAHPRHTGKPETRLANEAELYDKLVNWATKQSRGRRRVSITNGLFAHMKLAEQVKAVQEASVILGVHGAGLTHIVFARPSTVVVEILSPLFMRPHYQYISQWMGIQYHSIVMDEITVNCEQVIERLNDVLQQQV